MRKTRPEVILPEKGTGDGGDFAVKVRMRDGGGEFVAEGTGAGTEAKSGGIGAKKWILGVILAVFLGALVGTAGFFGYYEVRLAKQGYSTGVVLAALKNGVHEVLAGREYNATVEEALKSGEFRGENLEMYYLVKPVEGATGRINQLLAKGYGVETIDLVNEKLGETEVEWVLEQPYLAGLKGVLGSEYFRSENLARYLAMVRLLTGEEEPAWVAQLGEGTLADAAVIGVNMALDREPYEDATEVTEFNELMLVNRYHFLGEEFVPEGLVEIEQGCVKGAEKAELSEVAAEAFEAMCLAAKEEGLGLVANSGYRGHQAQEAVMAETVQKYGQEYAEKYVSPAGFSEHQTGLALDVAAISADYFPETEEYQWILTNASKYGFILRYPEGKEAITGIEPEAWHLRYVGEAVAEKLANSGLTLEEYLATKISEK